MRVLLLNDGGFSGMSCIEFPVEVEVLKVENLYYILPNELERIGATLILLKELPYLIFTKDDVEEL